ncbi:beta-1,6-N-acetylglucosaminyltransferase [Microvirga arabica]|uniref:beta-1,6-N-acetylglucosaminyltransferase n=1 Tax=Microvirga arabica TaxID=1128671 RepID=UPI00193A1505|nr:beta-1,6-N-acetylglucosaminyltransferase [Microvirga arabica]MBM1171281.1 hypothetical protein [Microvirga arabica]
MRKIALLVLGASAPRIAGKLGAAFVDKDRYSIYVHVDAKQDLARYTAEAGSVANLRYLETRFNVFWAGFNMIKATMALMDTALRDPDNKYFVLMSDDTCPLMSPGAMYERIVTHDMAWIHCWPVPQNHIFHYRYERFFYMDSKFSNPRWFENEERFFSDDDAQAISDLTTLQARGKKPLRQLYAGKQWWILKRIHIASILQAYKEDEHLRESFRFSAVPDETYIHTIFKINFPKEDTFGTQVYDDFTRNPKPYIFKSREQIDAAALTKYLMMRKIDPNAVELYDALAGPTGLVAVEGFEGIDV